MHRRTFFFTTVVGMFAHASFMLESFAETLAKVAENLASPKGLLPPEALQNFSCTPQQICGYTGGFFINALESGSLVRTRAEYEGKTSTFYVKGFYAKSGNNLAFGPNNLFYSIVMSHGEILRATPETKYLPYGHYMEERIRASESIA